MSQTDRTTGLKGKVGLKIPVKAASTAALTLSGEQSVDGVSLVTGDRVLVKDQASSIDNGIYVVDTGDWSRALDFDGAYDAVAGTLVLVTDGTVAADLIYQLTTADPITIGETSLTFAVFSTASVITAIPVTTAQGGTGGTSAIAGLANLGVVQVTGEAGTANAQTGTIDALVTSLRADQLFIFGPSVTNTSACTLTLTPSGGSALAAKNVYSNGAALSGGELASGVPVLLQYDGTQFNIMSGAIPQPDDIALLANRATPSKRLRVDVSNVPASTTVVHTTGGGGFLPAGIGPLPYAGSTIPAGWLECDGSAVLRTTYAALFAAIGTTWGAGDGSTTFNLPPAAGRTVIGAGTGTVTEAVTASSSNGFTVAANNDKWYTGVAVVLSNLSGFTTSATAGPTYYAVRISSTNVRLATTLALAQNGTPDVTISGTGTATLTHTFTARTLAEQGGKEGHAMTSTELLAHTHPGIKDSDIALGLGGSATGSTTSGTATGSRGGNAAMPIMNPFLVTKMIISY